VATQPTWVVSTKLIALKYAMLISQSPSYQSRATGLNLSATMVLRKCLFCLTKQKHCCSYFAFSWKQLVEV